MCMEDVKIARNLYSEVRQISCPAGVETVIAQPSPDRYSLIISADNLDVVFIAPAPATATIASGICLPRNYPVQRFTVDDCGSMMRQAWKACPSSATVIITVIDSVLLARKSSELKDF